MTCGVIFTPNAEADLLEVAEWVAEQSSATVALAYVDRVKARTDQLSDFPNRGPAKPEFGYGIRSLSFERRLLILYRVDHDAVRVLRIVGARRDLDDITL